MMPNNAQNIADAKAIAAVGLAGATWVADLAMWLQIGATVVAIVAGVMASWYHYERAITLKQKRDK